MLPERRRGWRKWVNERSFLIAALLLFVLFVPMSAEISVDEGWVCAICGSRRGEISWIGGFKTGAYFRQSSLDQWIAQNAGGHTHDWRHIRGAIRNIFGRGIGSRHGVAPPIYSFPNDVQSVYMKSATTQQVTAFVQTMTSGTEAQQRLAVEQAADQAIGAMGAGASTISSVDPSKR